MFNVVSSYLILYRILFELKLENVIEILQWKIKRKQEKKTDKNKFNNISSRTYEWIEQSGWWIVDVPVCLPPYLVQPFSPTQLLFIIIFLLFRFFFPLFIFG